MPDRTVRTPGPDHPIDIRPTRGRVLVEAGGRIVADSQRALTLSEASLRPVQYIPREDVDMRLLVRSERRTWCPYKGECAYYSIPLGGARSVDAVWTYEAPFDAVARIAGYLAFYPDRVERLAVSPAR